MKLTWVEWSQGEGYLSFVQDWDFYWSQEELKKVSSGDFGHKMGIEAMHFPSSSCTQFCVRKLSIKRQAHPTCQFWLSSLVSCSTVQHFCTKHVYNTVACTKHCSQKVNLCKNRWQIFAGSFLVLEKEGFCGMCISCLKKFTIISLIL